MPRVLLEVISGQSQVKRAVAESGETIRLGRDALCDLSFPLDTAVSREHCRVNVGDEVISLADSSSYGTMVNGNQVKTVELQHGDRIGLGHGIVVAVIVDDDDDSSSEDGIETLDHASVACLGPMESLASLLIDSGLTTDPDSPVTYKIEFLSTEREGRVLSFPIDQAVVIGRLSSCDIKIATDPAVSRRHCRIVYEAPDLRLECRGTHGSKINGDPVEAAVVQDGDEIEIGASTRFRISFVYHGENQDEGDSFDTDDSVVLIRDDTDNGLSICRIETAAEESILTVLAEVLPDHHALMVLDRLKCGVDVEEELKAEQYLLCERYPVEVLPEISPILPSPDTWANPEFMQEINGCDSFLLVMSGLDADLEKVIAHLRELTDLNPARGTYSGGQTLFAYWWPSMIGSVFRNCSSDAAKELIREIDAFAYEVDDGAAVELIALPEFVDQLASSDGIKVRTLKRRKA
jgi:pSer/pThr/pTyr-binding forkhead associated (FHA) protein